MVSVSKYPGWLLDPEHHKGRGEAESTFTDTFTCHVAPLRSAPHPCSSHTHQSCGIGLNEVVSLVLPSSCQPNMLCNSSPISPPTFHFHLSIVSLQLLPPSHTHAHTHGVLSKRATFSPAGWNKGWLSCQHSESNAVQIDVDRPCLQKLTSECYLSCWTWIIWRFGHVCWTVSHF